ncbi:MAG: hypothetical protein KME07_08380 [Pegethrix bostrychoides GSE-TBD4-15B]|jgi:hypothetical protein|uniref:Uncharacterized protein n=1 Tax=Pegethrix bostrychoides GSE-TBD4-15B TaxID=2839662 RepID=A0A951P9P8_9CYAN|nr:hypothetical protein [Pegethrix bostrychoides GSE-TBD4-15B]
MAAKTRLEGIELIDCAKANAKQGLAEATRLCGYHENIPEFQQQLQQACQQIGVEISELSDLITDVPVVSLETGVQIAPDTESDL